MKRVYKLAANFNTVEFELDEQDIFQYYMDNYESYMWKEPEFDDDEGESVTWNVSEDVIIKAILQEEYDILASINVINVAPPIKQAEPVEKPSEKQIEWAKALGMKNPEKASKKEVWQYIQNNKKN